MVRMENPSPIQVGREFVRQYYTLLNKAPEMLHRFYGVNSSYVHGISFRSGETEEAVIGQMAIHKKITSLEFKECHTKVRQVDAYSTIGSGVVVQVIGELSNDRNPLRRFMQTFVLAPQGDNPYKFYVHNDVFRYEDEVFQEDVPQERLEEEQANEESEDEEPQSQTGQFDNHGGYYQNPAAQIISNGIEQREDAQETPLEPRQPSPSPVISAPSSPAAGSTQPHDSQCDQELAAPATTSDTEPETNTESTMFQPSGTEDLQPDTVPSADPPPVSAGTSPTSSALISVLPVEPEPTSQAFSWAALASKNTPQQHNIQQGTVVKVNQNEPPNLGESQPPRAQRSARGPVRTGYREDNDRGSGDRGGDGNQRRSVRYPDNQQIFVGNLPYDITESDLREHFTSYGVILEIRINHSHTSNPSFGFIIFQDPKSVEEVLSQMPTTFKNNKRINIEEKKQRTPMRGDGGRRGGGGMDMRRENARGNRMQQRAPPRRDRGGSREGQRPGGNFGTRR